MDRNALARDAFELVQSFAVAESTQLGQMKEVWRARGFSFIFEACQKTCVPERFMQTLYSCALGYIVSQYTLSWRLGGFYAMYILYETQPFPSKVRIYLSLDDLRMMLGFVRDMKQMQLGEPLKIMKRLMDEQAFLFGHTSVTPKSVKAAKERRIVQTQAAVQNALPRVFADTPAEDHLCGSLAAGLELTSTDIALREYHDLKNRVFQVLGNGNEHDASANVIEELRKISEDRDEFRKSLQNLAPRLEQQQPDGPMTWPSEGGDYEEEDQNDMSGFMDDLDELLMASIENET